MTKSKIFIAGALIVVATCGAFATKAVNKLTSTVWYTDHTGATVSVELTPCSATSGSDCTKFLDGAQRTIYVTTDSNTGAPITPYTTSN